jgi:hypothetical protein
MCKAREAGRTPVNLAQLWANSRCCSLDLGHGDFVQATLVKYTKQEIGQKIIFFIKFLI